MSALEGRQDPPPTTDDVLVASSQNANTTSLGVPEDANYQSVSQSTAAPSNPGSDEDIEQRSQGPEWSVVYHPEVERALELHLAHTFTYDSELDCIKISPDGQRLAVGGDGKTYLNELETGSNIWSVSAALVLDFIWIDLMDASVFVDRYVKNSIGIWSVQFSPNGQLLATGASDDRIRVCYLKIRMTA